MGSATRLTPPDGYPEPMRTRIAERLAQAERELARELTGIVDESGPRPGLFPIHATGISLAPLVAAAQSFLGRLDDEQRRAATFDIGNRAWRSWHNIHLYLMRHGVCLDDLDAGQRDAGLAVLRATLSASGFETARGVMKLNEHIAELTGRPEEFGEWYYWLSIFGTPSETEPWGWQIDGHHLIVNCFVLGDQLVLTPSFIGSEPVVAASGRYAGTRVLDAEEACGLAFMRSLTPDQQRRAVVGTTLPRDVLTTALTDNLVLPYAGIRFDELDAAQRSAFEGLIQTYVDRIRPGHAAVKMDEVRRHLADTTFAWIGGHDDTCPFYYRIHSPVVLIEFDHLPGVAYENTEPTRRHIHTIVRTPNGNDYGHDLLRQHYRQHDHDGADPHRHGQGG